MFSNVLSIACRSDLVDGREALVFESWPCRLNPFAALQMALLVTLHWRVDGPISARAQKVVAAELRLERAATLRLQTAARIVLVKGRRCATRKAVQVGLVGVDDVVYLFDLLFVVFHAELFSTSYVVNL